LLGKINFSYDKIEFKLKMLHKTVLIAKFV